MKLAEALQTRADLQNKVEELRNRLINSAKYQEGEKPLEDPAELLEELDNTCDRLSEIIYKINYTNSITNTELGTLTKALAKKDKLSLKRSVYESLSDAASSLNDRYSNSEIKMFPSVDVRKLRKKIDLISKDLRTTDLTIQQANWLTDLAEIEI